MLDFKEQMPYTYGEKRYHTLAYDLQRRFGGRVWKAAVDAGFTCPNRDGTKGWNGCAFCFGGSSRGNTWAKSPVRQVQEEQERIRRKWPNARVIAYFQAYTNTYAPLERLRAAFEPVVELPGVCGISIGTRPDCLPTDALDYLQVLSVRTDLTVELGLQTSHDVTAEQIGRGYDWLTFVKAFEELRRRRIRICVHLINGLPGEDLGKMLETAERVGGLRPDGVKIHVLQILADTPMARWWERGEVPLLSKEDYTAVVCRQLEWFPPETVIERLTGDAPKELVLAPDWRCGKIAVLAGIDRALKREDRWQGKRYAQNHQLE